MDIQSVKRLEDENEDLIGYLLNGESSVPIDEGNRHYKVILDWLNDDNDADPADIIIVPDTSKKDKAKMRLKEAAKNKKTIADLLIVLDIE